MIRHTGFRPDPSGVDLFGFTENERIEPSQYRGLVADESGWYFVGPFFY